jgi:hypothetical protein
VNDEPLNEADRVARASIAAQFSARQDEWADGLADDIVLDDRRRGGREVFAGKERVLTEWGADAWGEAGALRTCEVGTVAARGDNLVLLSGVVSLGDVLSYSWVGIDRIDADGKVDLIAVFDPADIAAATEELDRLAADG